MCGIAVVRLALMQAKQKACFDHSLLCRCSLTGRYVISIIPLRFCETGRCLI